MSGTDQFPLSIKQVGRSTVADLTRDDVAARVASLLSLDLTNREAAAVGADKLRCDVLVAIAGGAPDSVFLAQLALLTVEEDIGGKRNSQGRKSLDS